MNADGSRTIRIDDATYRQLEELVARVRVHGWIAVGAVRPDIPSVGAVVNEGIAILVREAKARAPGVEARALALKADRRRIGRIRR